MGSVVRVGNADIPGDVEAFHEPAVKNCDWIPRGKDFTPGEVEKRMKQ